MCIDDFLSKRTGCAKGMSATKLKAEPASLEIIQSNMSTFHIMKTIVNVGQGVLSTEKNVSKDRK